MRCAAPVHQEEKGLSIAPQAALLKLEDLLRSLSVQYSCITFEKKLGEKVKFSLVTVLACLKDLSDEGVLESRLFPPIVLH